MGNQRPSASPRETPPNSLSALGRSLDLGAGDGTRVGPIAPVVGGVGNVVADREASSVEVTGDNVSVEAVVKALNDAGFHATVK